MTTAHRSPSADAGALQAEGIVIAEIVCGEGETNHMFALNGGDAAAEASLFVKGEFESGVDAERVELAAGGVEEGFGVGEFFDGDAARVERGGGHERAGVGDAKADVVPGEVEAFAGEGQHVAVVFGGDAKAQACAASWKNDDTLPPRDATQEFDAEPRCAVKGGQLSCDRRVERVAMIGGQLSPLNGKVNGDMWGCVGVGGVCESILC